MFESLGTLALVAGILVLWLGRKPIKTWLDEAEEDFMVATAVKAPERTAKVQEAYKDLAEVRAKYGDNVVSAKQLLDEARGLVTPTNTKTPD